MRYKFKLKEFIHHPIKTEVLEELKWEDTDTLVLDGYNASPISFKWNVKSCLKNIHLIILK